MIQKSTYSKFSLGKDSRRKLGLILLACFLFGLPCLPVSGVVLPSTAIGSLHWRTSAFGRLGRRQTTQVGEVHLAWMDEMRRQGVKRAWIVVYTGGSDSPQQWTIDEEAYYKEYEREGSQIVDPLWLRRIKKGGLAHTLDEVALHRAVHSPWTKHDTMLIPVDLLDSEKIPPESYQQENDEILQVAAQVRPESDIGQDLQSGVHGDGIHYLWMDKMRNAGARRAVAILDISFHDDGTPNKIRVAAIHYYGAYDSDESLIKDLNFLALVKGNALDHDLREIAVERASRGFWFDVPRPRPQPFVGGTAVEFLDNGWLPTFDQGHPMFTTGRPDQTGW